MSLKPAWNPKPYQKRAIKLLLSQASGGLLLDPGLGKTSTVLATIKILLAKGMIKRVLVIAPIQPMYSTWPGEIKKWSDFEGITYAILHDKVKEWNLDCDVNIHLINPEGLKWLFDPNTKRPEYDLLVVDESSKFKDSSTKRFKFFKPFVPQFKRRWILTGTPVPNGLVDLFGQIYILDLGRSLGRFITHFRNEFCDNHSKGFYPDWRPKPDAFPKIVERISPLVLQLSAEDYLEMPELIYINREVVLPSAAMKIYGNLEKEYIDILEKGAIVAANAAVAGVKLRQVANGAVYGEERTLHVIHDEKLGALESLLEELGGAPTLVLYEFNHDRDRILQRLGPVPILGGGINGNHLEELIDRFNAGEIRVLLGHPASMAHGLNLQGACHHVIWFGIPWNLEFYDQAIARVYRQGQQASHVYVYHIVAKNTKDEEVLKVLQQKDKTQQGLLSALHAHRETNYSE